jgi:cyclophilin family peptidyl-prolyl cis-trans isomerase
MRGRLFTLLAFACALFITSARATTATTIIAQPKAATVNAGSTATFSVVATNGTITGYQWSVGTVLLHDGTTTAGAMISGSQTASLTIENVGTNYNVGLFHVAVSNSATTVNSASVRLIVMQGTLAKFDTSLGPIVVELFDHDKPITVQNFLRYAIGGPTSGAYLNSFFSRLEKNFVLQGGGFAPIATSSADLFTNEYYLSDAAFTQFYNSEPGVPGFIVNEGQVGPRVHNTYGTLAMATISGSPNTARSEWFFNLADNTGGATNLDSINGGYAVFGRVVQGLDVLNAFNNLPSEQILSVTVSDTTFGTKTFPTLPTKTSDAHNVHVSDLYFTSISLLTRSYLDLVKPTGKFVFPLPNARLTNGNFTLRGTALDNLGISSVVCVDCFYNAVGPDPVSQEIANGITVTGTTNWTADMHLHPGPWSLKFRITDGFGNWIVVSESIVITDPLTVQTNGIGKILPSYNGQFLEPEKRYAMTAVPGVGQLFAYWTGIRNGQTWMFPFNDASWAFFGSDSVKTGPNLGPVVSTPALTFTMYSNLTLTATFVSNYFPVVQGTYYGLIVPTDHNSINASNTGLCKISSTVAGSFTGTMAIQGKVLPFAGKWDYAGIARNISIPRAGTTPLTANLSIDLSNNLGTVTGTVQSADWTSDITAYRQVAKLTTSTVPRSGNFVLKIPSQSSDLGESVATVTVSPLGTMTFTGTMADNTPWTELAGVSKEGYFPIFASLYTGRGLVVGQHQFSSSTNSFGPTRWIRPAISNAFYTNGFSTVGSNSYLSLVAKPVTNSTYVLRLGGNTLPEVTYNLHANTLGQLLVSSGPTNKLSIVLTTTTGAINGTWIDSNKGLWILKGVFGTFDDPNSRGTGFIIGPHGRTGYLHIDAAP